jgi:hypothetical protein
MRILRWIFFLPASFICGYLAYLVGGTLNNLSITLFTGSPPAGWIKVATDVMAHMYMGAACTYAGVKIAPAHPKLVAAGIFAIQLIFAGASIWSSFVIGKYYAIPAVLGLLFGGVVLLIATIAGEIGPYGDVCAGAK